MRPFRCSRRRRGGAALVAGTLAAGLGGAPSVSFAQEKPQASPSAPVDLAAIASGECCLMLLYPIGARRAALSEAVTAIPSSDAVFYNPAGLAELEDNHFVIHHVVSSLVQIDGFTLLLSPGNVATFGLTYELIDHGDQDVGPGPVPTGQITYREHLLVASFATPVAVGFSAGLNYKYFASRQGCSGECGTPDVNAGTHGLDFGVQYRPLWLSSLQLGASLLNVGFPLQVINSEQADPMPTRLRLGVAYDVLDYFDPAGPYRLWLMLEAEEENWRTPTSPTPSFAFELSAGEVVFLRAGYGGGEGMSAGPSVGVGVVYSSFNVAVAKRVSSGGLGDEPFQLSVDVDF